MFQGSNYQYASVGSDNGLVPNTGQAIIWNKGGLVYRGIYATVGLNELSICLVTMWNQKNNSEEFYSFTLKWCYFSFALTYQTIYPVNL